MTPRSVVPPFLLHAGFVRAGVQIAAPLLLWSIRLRTRMAFTAETELVNISGPAIRAREQKGHRHLAKAKADDRVSSSATGIALAKRSGYRLAYFWRESQSNLANSSQELSVSLR
jgi:hypothetical protein